MATIFFLFMSIPATHAQVTLQYQGCYAIKATIPSSDIGCTNCFNSAPSNGGTRMFTRFDLKKRTGSGSFTVVDTKINTTSRSATFDRSDTGNGTEWKIEAFVSQERFGCQFPYSGGQCPGQWVSLEETDEFELGPPTFIVNLEDGNDDSPFDNVYCTDDVSVSDGGLAMNTVFSNSVRGYQVLICQIDSNDQSSCKNQKGTGWIPGKLPASFNLLTDLWRTSPNNSWRFWPNNDYRVTVAVKSLPCVSWLAQEFTFTVNNSECN